MNRTPLQGKQPIRTITISVTAEQYARLLAQQAADPERPSIMLLAKRAFERGLDR